MATDQDFAGYVLEQLREVPRVRHRKMFGEYAVYANDRVVALLCDNQLFVRPTTAGRAVLAGSVTEAPPYPGAKMHFLIEGELEDTAFLARLIAATLTEVPLPKSKKKKAATAESAKHSKPAPKK